MYSIATLGHAVNIHNPKKTYFGHIASEERGAGQGKSEKEEMQELRAQYAPLLPSEVDHWFVTDTSKRPAQWKDMINPLAPVVRLVKGQSENNSDQKIKRETMQRNGRVTSYTLHKLPADERDADSLANSIKRDSPEFTVTPIKVGRPDWLLVYEEQREVVSDKLVDFLVFKACL